jgi:hypothetical protein
MSRQRFTVIVTMVTCMCITLTTVSAASRKGTDADHDGLTHKQEHRHHTNAHRADTDRDGMPDGWEVYYRLSPTRPDGERDPDGDGLSNVQEYRTGHNPHLADASGSLPPTPTSPSSPTPSKPPTPPPSSDATGPCNDDSFTDDSEGLCIDGQIASGSSSAV